MRCRDGFIFSDISRVEEVAVEVRYGNKNGENPRLKIEEIRPKRGKASYFDFHFYDFCFHDIPISHISVGIKYCPFCGEKLVDKSDSEEERVINNEEIHPCRCHNKEAKIIGLYKSKNWRTPSNIIAYITNYKRKKSSLIFEGRDFNYYTCGIHHISEIEVDTIKFCPFCGRQLVKIRKPRKKKNKKISHQLT